MKVYLVGGAVRDALLGLPVRERDWVVVGATAEQMVAQGYRCVGKHFPVFLHPESHEEYALARTESKTAPGYRGFSVQTGPQVSLKMDLQRRDLSINAMAQAKNQTLVDPFGGGADLAARSLRHVSPAFAEDPVRVLRLARFAARFWPLGFRVHASTRTLVRRMAAGGELDALVPERCWQELRRALLTAHPEVFFKTLADCEALAAVFPELDAGGRDFGLGLAALQSSTRVCASPAVRLAAFTTVALDPGRSDSLAKRLRLPREVRDALLLSQRVQDDLPIGQGTPEAWMRLLEHSDSLRQPKRFFQALFAVHAARGQFPPCLSAAVGALRTLRQVDVTALLKQGHHGPGLAQALREARVQALRAGEGP